MLDKLNDDNPIDNYHSITISPLKRRLQVTQESDSNSHFGITISGDTPWMEECEHQNITPLAVYSTHSIFSVY